MSVTHTVNNTIKPYFFYRMELESEEIPFVIVDKKSRGIVPSGETSTLHIAFVPTQEGRFTASIAVSTKTGIFRARLAALAVTAEISISPMVYFLSFLSLSLNLMSSYLQEINFGVIGINSPRMEKFTITSMSDQDLILSYSVAKDAASFLKISRLGSHGDDASGILGELKGKSSIELGVEFSGGAPEFSPPHMVREPVSFFLDGIPSGSLYVNGSAAKETLNIEPAELRFGKVAVGFKASKFVHFHNVGGAYLSLHLIQEQGNNVSSTVDISFDTSSLMLYPGQRKRIEVTAIPRKQGPQYSSIAVVLTTSSIARQWKVTLEVDGAATSMSNSIKAILSADRLQCLSDDPFDTEEDNVQQVSKTNISVNPISIADLIAAAEPRGFCAQFFFVTFVLRYRRVCN